MSMVMALVLITPSYYQTRSLGISHEELKEYQLAKDAQGPHITKSA